MSVSPKVSAATVGAAAATVVTSVVANHLFHGSMPSDVLGLVEAVVTAGITFAAGYLVRHVPAEVVHAAEAVAKDVVPSAGA